MNAYNCRLLNVVSDLVEFVHVNNETISQKKKTGVAGIVYAMQMRLVFTKFRL